MELIRTWLLGIVCTAMIAALAEQLAPKGAAKRLTHLACGLLLIVSMVRPLIALDADTFSSILTEYQADAGGYSAALALSNRELVISIIEEESAAYIQDKAAELDASCTVTVECDYGGEDVPFPVRAEIVGDLTQEQIDALTGIIEADFGLAAERQSYTRGGTS